LYFEEVLVIDIESVILLVRGGVLLVVVLLEVNETIINIRWNIISLGFVFRVLW